LAIEDCAFHVFIIQAAALLHKVYAEHARQADGQSATAFAFAVVRLNRSNRFGRWRKIADIAEQSLAPGQLSLSSELQQRETLLLGRPHGDTNGGSIV
jgi:hypothetical protein